MLKWRIQTKLKSYVAKAFVHQKRKTMQEYNQNHDFSIISSNCIGCLLTHDLGIRFNSPTVNLSFNAEDFVEFASRLEYYLSVPFSHFSRDEKWGWPIGYLNNLKIDFVHYKTEEECIRKWEERKCRINWDNLFLICTDRDGMTSELLKKYLALPYKKIIFVSKKNMCINDECVYIPGFESNGQVPEMDKFADWMGHRYYEKYFDMVGWLNGK